MRGMEEEREGNNYEARVSEIDTFLQATDTTQDKDKAIMPWLQNLLQNFDQGDYSIDLYVEVYTAHL